MNKGNELFHTHTYLFIHVAGDAQGRRSTPTSSGTSEMKVLFRTSGLRMFDPNGRSRPLVGPDDRLALIEAAVLENGECWAFALCLRCWWTTSWNSSGTTSWSFIGDDVLEFIGDDSSLRAAAGWLSAASLSPLSNRTRRHSGVAAATDARSADIGRRQGQGHGRRACCRDPRLFN